jgi:8-oxo-dGTP pyrophosphatase MutT (NUDIX family)
MRFIFKMRKIKVVSAGIVPVRKIKNDYYYLMLRSFKKFWDFPKGKLEGSEGPLEAAKRETREESSLKETDLSFNWGYDSYVTEPYKRGTKRVIYFLAETNRSTIFLPINEELGMPEHDGYSWMTFEEALDITNERVGGVLKWANAKIHG